MKINEIVEAEGRIKQGLKDVGRGLGGIGKGVGVGIMKAFDRFGGGTGKVGIQGVDFDTPKEKTQALAARAAALADSLKLVNKRGELPTETQLVQQYIKQGFSRQEASSMAENDFTTMQEIKAEVRSQNPGSTDTQLNLETKKEFLKQQTKSTKQTSSSPITSKLARDLQNPGDESFAQAQPAVTASELVSKINAVSANPLVYQYGKQQYHLNGRGNWAKFPGEKEVPQTVAALLNQAADRDNY